ncbi:MAG: RrF2 family transcriptional regulator [Blautia sp.]|jgi:Rrf2 family protein
MTSEFTIAVHALTVLNHRAAVVKSEALAENVCTNAARIRKVMAKLKKAGIVETKEGVDGGYLFVKDSAQVNLYMVASALDVDFVSASWKSGNPDMDCLIASGMATVMEELYGRLDAECKEQLKHITIEDIDGQIFHTPCNKK